LDDQLCFALYAATNAVIRAYRPMLAEMDLSYSQYLVMLVMWQDGSQTIGSVAKRLQLPASAITPLVDKLEKAGFITRDRSADDRRVVQLNLTPEGHAIERAAAGVQDIVTCRTGLDEEAFKAMRESLHALADRMTDEMVAQAKGGGHQPKSQQRRVGRIS